MYVCLIFVIIAVSLIAFCICIGGITKFICCYLHILVLKQTNSDFKPFK